MKEVPLLLLTLASVFFIIGCEKPDDSDKTSLRITKFADNLAKNNPTTFEYNSNGQLTTVQTCFGDFSRVEIGYNENNLPIIESMYDDQGLAYEIEIEWTNEGFIASSDNTIAKYYLNAEKRIQKVVETDAFSGDTTLMTILTWYNNDSLKCIDYELDNNTHCIKECAIRMETFGNVNHPCKGMNIALFVTLSGELYNDFSGDIEYQNQFSLIKTDEISETYNHVNRCNISHDSIQNSYPIYSELHFTGRYDTETYDFFEYRYFEYESY